MLVCRPCDYTSGNLNKTSVERKVWRCLSANRLIVSELFHDIWLISNVRRDYAGLWIALSVLRKGVIVWFPDCVDRQNSEMWSRGWAVAPKYSAPAINAFFSVYLRWLFLGKPILDSGKLDLGLVSAG